jgi:methionyl aminopeptidase
VAITVTRAGRRPGRLRANEACWCGSGRKLKRCHGDHEPHRRRGVAPAHVGPLRSVPDHVTRPPYVGAMGRKGVPVPQVFVGADLDRMRRAGRVAAEVLLETGAAVAPGVTTDHLDDVAHEAYLARDAYPSTLGYGTYAKSVCTSVNDVVCHGIPDHRPLQHGDIVNIDVTAYVDGVHGDTSATFAVGGVDALDEPTRALVESTLLATMRGIDAVAPGLTIREVGRAIEAFAHSRGYGVVEECGGHGIGEVFHAEPHVFHTDHRQSVLELVPGLCFTVEPMLNAGTRHIAEWDDGWTIVTDDGLPSAQFEHTVCVSEGGVEILTVTADGHTAVRWPNDT